MAEDKAASGASGAARAGISATRFNEAIDQIRKRADSTAKGVAAIGTAAITAIGYVKLADVFPYGGPDSALLALCAGVVLMLLAVVISVRRFNRATKSIITSSDEQRTFTLNKMKEDEKKLLCDAYRETASLNGVELLRTYEARGQRLERIAERLPEEQAEVLSGQVDQIFSEVKATQARAAAFVLRHRAWKALFSLWTLLWIGVFVAGWYATALGADALQSERDRVGLAKECAEARAAKKVIGSEIPEEICGKPAMGGDKDEEAEEASPEATRASTTTAIATAAEKCETQARKAKSGGEACRALREALSVANNAGPGSDGER